jgi:hypothetical protein
MQLPGIPNCTVTVNTGEGFNGNKSWAVTFTSLLNAGDVPELGFNGSMLSGSDVGGSVFEWVKGNALGVQEIIIGGGGAGESSDLSSSDGWGGTFTLGYNSTERNPACDIPEPKWNTTQIPDSFSRSVQTKRNFHRLYPFKQSFEITPALSVNASAGQVQVALSSLPGLGEVLVQKVFRGTEKKKKKRKKKRCSTMHTITLTFCCPRSFIPP